MEAKVVTQAVDRGTEGLRLLEHPFYRRWEAGGLSRGELADYAGQYRHFESMLPGFLERVADALCEGKARQAALANLEDELGDPVPHLVLFDQFADALGAGRSDPSPATAALLAAYQSVAAAGAVPALAGLAAYESQASEVAASKAEGLRARYGLDSGETAFWDHHAGVEIEHSRWTTEALAALNADEAVVTQASRIVAEAWWSFLDEREAARTA